jgi:hypothetical protein
MSIATSAGLELVARYGAPERWLAVLVTLRPDGEPSTSVVTAGALPHPVTGEQVVAHTINEPASAGSYKALKAAGKERQPPWSGRAQRIGHLGQPLPDRDGFVVADVQHAVHVVVQRGDHGTGQVGATRDPFLLLMRGR